VEEIERSSTETNPGRNKRSRAPDSHSLEGALIEGGTTEIRKEGSAFKPQAKQEKFILRKRLKGGAGEDRMLVSPYCRGGKGERRGLCFKKKRVGPLARSPRKKESRNICKTGLVGDRQRDLKKEN